MLSLRRLRLSSPLEVYNHMRLRTKYIAAFGAILTVMGALVSVLMHDNVHPVGRLSRNDVLEIRRVVKQFATPQWSFLPRATFRDWPSFLRTKVTFRIVAIEEDSIGSITIHADGTKEESEHPVTVWFTFKGWPMTNACALERKKGRWTIRIPSQRSHDQFILYQGSNPRDPADAGHMLSCTLHVIGPAPPIPIVQVLIIAEITPQGVPKMNESQSASPRSRVVVRRSWVRGTGAARTLCWLACAVTLDLAAGLVSGAEFRLSFLEEQPVLEDTCQLLMRSGVSESAAATFKKLVQHHNQNGNRVDKSGFPPAENGYYHFQSLSELSNRVHHSFCVTPGNDTFEQQTLMCFDVTCLLLKGAGFEAPRAEQGLVAKRLVLLNQDEQAEPADYATFRNGSHLLFPAEGYEYFVGRPRSEAENKLALSLRGTRQFGRQVSNSQKDLRGVFKEFVGQVERDGFKFPERFQVGLGCWVNLKHQYLKPDHAFICIRKGGRLVCVEKDGAKGPYVRVEFESEQDLARYVVWGLNPDFNEPRTRQYSSAVLVSLNRKLVGLFPSHHPP